MKTLVFENSSIFNWALSTLVTYLNAFKLEREALNV